MLKPIALTEFLSCHTNIKHEHEIKGIYFSRNSSHFVIFINRFYLITEIDLIRNQNEFKQADSRNLEFDDLLAEPTFEILQSKWIKTLVMEPNFNACTFLAISKDFVFDVVFNLSAPYKPIRLKQINEGSNEFDCEFNLINFGENVYCFQETIYHLKLDNKKKTEPNKIAHIFASGQPKLFENEKLKFIFPYKTNQIAFMTDNRTLLLDYYSFKVDEPNKSLSFNLSKKIESYDNNLFNLLKKIKITPIETRGDSKRKKYTTRPTATNKIKTTTTKIKTTTTKIKTTATTTTTKTKTDEETTPIYVYLIIGLIILAFLIIIIQFLVFNVFIDDHQLALQYNHNP